MNKIFIFFSIRKRRSSFSGINTSGCLFASSGGMTRSVKMMMLFVLIQIYFFLSCHFQSIALVRLSGGVSILTTDSQKNILGDSPEFFAGATIFTQPYNCGFFILVKKFLQFKQTHRMQIIFLFNDNRSARRLVARKLIPLNPIMMMIALTGRRSMSNRQRTRTMRS
jgi:hypothetical protein